MTIRRSRLEARAITQSTFKTRAISGGVPDVINVSVVDRRADGLYEVKRDHWPVTIFVPCVPNVEIPYPCRAQMMFEDGHVHKGFLYWPHSARRLNGGTVGTIYAWPSYRNGFARLNCIGDFDHITDTGSGALVYPLFWRASAGILYEYGGSYGHEEIGGGWQLNGASESAQWLDFSVNDQGLLIQVSGYTNDTRGDVLFDGALDPEYGPSQKLEQRTSAGVFWQWTLPSWETEYDFEGEGPPGGGGGGGGAGGF